MKAWKLNRQLAFGFALVLFFTGIVGVAGLVSLRNVSKVMDTYREVNGAKSDFNDAKQNIAQFLLNSHEQGREKQAEAGKAAGEKMTGIIDGIKAAQEQSDLSDAARESLQALLDS